jgi:pyrimidine deaminase RibD-like protein
MGGPNNPESAAWQELGRISEGPEEVLRARYGIHFPLFQSSGSPVERVFEANHSILTIRFNVDEKEICASISKGRRLERRFKIVGSISRPMLSEGRAAPRDVEPTFADVAAWFVGASIAPQTSGDSDRDFARIAIDEARKSVAESDGRPHPKVGAVVVKNGAVLRVAHRGELPASHAEYIALEGKLSDEAVAGATVYTTLEPCTTRNHPKIPCAQRLIERRVARVVIGMLDPDSRITGRGQRKLRAANIITDFFPHDLMAEVEELNREFTRYCEQQTQKEEPRTRENCQHWPDVLLMCHWPSQINIPTSRGFHIVRDRVWELSATSVGPLYNVEIQDIDFGEFRASFEPVDCLANDVVPCNAQILDLATNNMIRTHDLETLITHSPTGCDIARYATNDPLAFEIPICVTYSDARGNKFEVNFVFKYDVYHEEGRMVRNGGIKKR